MLLNIKFNFETWGSHGIDSEEQWLLGCDIVKFGTSLSTFRMKLFPPYSGSKIKPHQKTNSNIACCLLGLFIDPEEVGRMFLRNFGKHVRNYTASYHIRQYWALSLNENLKSNNGSEFFNIDDVSSKFFRNTGIYLHNTRYYIPENLNLKCFYHQGVEINADNADTGGTRTCARGR
jgi:hypothetical protein